MKQKASLSNRISKTITALLCTGSLMMNSCTTQSTAYQVQTQPMTVDLEKKVLKQTIFSGTVIGAAAGAATGGFLSAVAAKAAGGSDEDVKRALATGMIVGGTAGGAMGYREGQKKGQQMIAGAMTRDQARQLISGAQLHNQQLASYNSGLKSKIASVQQFSDPKQKKIAYKTLVKQTGTVIRNADEKLESRNKALQSDKWAGDTGTEKGQYQQLTNSMRMERDALATYSSELSKLEQSMVY
jgi:hypothetical protein